MSSIVTSVLGSVVGLLCNKARDTTAYKLREGDVTDFEIRKVVVRELNDINSKLDGLSRKDQLSSYRFLKEGVDLLSIALDQAKDIERTILNERSEDVCGSTTGMLSGAEAGILSEALELSQTVGKLKLNDKEFETATKRFEEARKAATHAFCNEALSIQDRIFAAKLRVASEILEWLESPKTAITGCLSFLQELHSLPAVRNTFSVYLNGGFKSIFKKAERVSNVESLMLINYVIFQFVSKFSSKFSIAFAWPTIELDDRQFNPILDWQEISTRESWSEELIHPPNRLKLENGVHTTFSAVNNRGEVIVMSGYDDIAVISKNGENKVVKLLDPRQGEVIRKRIVGLAVDKNNNIYVVRYLKTKEKAEGIVESHVLYVFDENYNYIKHETKLDFLEIISYNVRIAINNNNDTIMIKDSDCQMYVCDMTGQLKYKTKWVSWFVDGMSITDKNEIMTPSHDRKAVRIYTENGDLKSTIKVPEAHEVWDLAFHYVMRKILVVANIKGSATCFLLCYSKTGELENSWFLCDKDSRYQISMASHPSGSVAIITNKSITYL